MIVRGCLKFGQAIYLSSELAVVLATRLDLKCRKHIPEPQRHFGLFHYRHIVPLNWRIKHPQQQGVAEYLSTTSILWVHGGFKK